MGTRGCLCLLSGGTVIAIGVNIEFFVIDFMEIENSLIWVICAQSDLGSLEFWHVVFRLFMKEDIKNRGHISRFGIYLLSHVSNCQYTSLLYSLLLICALFRNMCHI